MNETVNTFEKGMSQDVSKAVQGSGTYRYGKNVRVVRNSSPEQSVDQSENGANFSVSQIRGTLPFMSLCEGYEPIGFLEVEEGIIIISTDDTYSQIGICRKQSNSYITLFDDRNDPNGDRMGLKKGKPINDIDACWENEFIKRVYFTDGVVEKMCFNYALAFRADGNPYHHNQACGSTVVYPKFLSVHAFGDRMDLIFPRDIKFVKNIEGALKTGVYQFFVRYVSEDGHKSTFSYVTRHFFLTQSKIDDITKTNHHNRKMYRSNEVTEMGIELLVAGVDTRWDYVEIGYAFSITDNITHEAGIFKKVKITGNDVAVKLQSHQIIEPISTDLLNERFESIKSVGTFVQHKNRMYEGNVKIYPTVELDLSSAIIEPAYKYMLADSTLEPGFAAVPNPVRGNNPSMPDNDPLTNSLPVTSSVTVNKFTGVTETYSIINDYENYKGVQFEHLFTGHWRGETYDYAVVVYDRKGNTSYAQHIMSYTFPQQYEGLDDLGLPKNSLTRFNQSIGRYELRLLGAKVSGIKIPASAMFDEFGKINVSGFEIVRTKRVKQILHQGVIFPSIKRYSNKEEDQSIVFPLPFLSNYFQSAYANKYPNSHLHRVNIFDTTKNTVTDVWDSASHPFLNTYHSPDIYFEEKIDAAGKSDYIRVVSSVHRAYQSSYIKLVGDQKHFYSKSYKTDNTDNSGAKGRPRIGTRSRVGFVKRIETSYSKLKEFDPDDLTAEFWSEDFATIRSNGTTGSPFPLASLYPKGSVILKSLDVETYDVTKGLDNDSSFFIVNYERPSDNYFSTESENSTKIKVYQGTGHFQQINQQTLDLCEKELNTDGSIKNYVFNNIEVWGGDCFVNLFDFAKNIPYWERNCKKTNRGVMDNHYGEFIPQNLNPDYACGLIIPIESNYNIAMRHGRSFAANATMSQATACDNLLPQFSNGISVYSPEDWNINITLSHEENVRFYGGKPNDIKLLSNKPSSIYISDVKVFSELDDNYRKKRVLNYTDLQGNYGPVVSLQKAFNYIYVFQHSSYGILRTSERAITPTNIGEVLLGTGKDLDGVDYISSEIGCQHRHSIKKYKNSIYWVDARKGVINRHSQAGQDNLSDDRNMHDFARSQCTVYDLEPEFFSGKNPYWITTGIDEEHSDILFTFITPTGNRTLMYNEGLNTFHGFVDLYPRIYFRYRNDLFCVNPQITNQICQANAGQYGNFFDVFYNSILSFVVNPSPIQYKSFDNGVLGINVGNYDKMISFISHQTEEDTHIMNYSPDGLSVSDDRFKYRNNELWYPIFQKGKPRLRGKYMTVTLVIKNSSQLQLGRKAVRILSYKTKFRILAKI